MKKIAALEGAKEYSGATEALGDMLEALTPKKSGQQAESAPGLTVQTVFERLGDAFQPDKAMGVDVVFQFQITGAGGGDWHVSIKDAACQTESGEHASPTTTIIMSDDDFLSLVAGKLNAMQAYTSGKLKIKGDLMKSQLIEKLFKFGSI